MGSLFGISWSLPHDPSEKVHPTVAGGVPARGGLLDADMRTLRLLSPRDRSRPRAAVDSQRETAWIISSEGTRTIAIAIDTVPVEQPLEKISEPTHLTPTASAR